MIVDQINHLLENALISGRFLMYSLDIHPLHLQIKSKKITIA
jgi:hypothetical protein